MQKHEPRPLICTTYKKKNSSKWINDLNKTAKTTTFLKKKIRENLCDFWLGKDFLNRIQKH